ncbi:TlpA family protein disulfide reductase [Flavobacterium sedimenticola]|uniref:TlpA disulfide reductase family protein n=1 Tax=Flavobacterium sedimenticola TaxID=3043286 RepID=A0ABT6XR55_9FLAO|nr:TlpA disulfide reductase family protein [Flavobacterium sedimenticola]MDI9257577.1 TlpA disulfide reductase family protein [Flavobacterium sedimenticola]
MKKIYVLLFLLAGNLLLQAQEIKVYEKFDAFQKEVLKANDTIYVINFCATWCGPCIKELPHFEKLHTDNKKVKVILVSLDSRKDLEKKLIPFVKKKKITAEVLLLSDKDYNTWLPKIDKNWSGSIPATLILMGKQQLFAETDFESYEQLNTFVTSFIHPNN